MKTILLDHGRRWWWVFLLIGTYSAILGWSLASPDLTDTYWQGQHAFLATLFKIQSTMVLMQSSCLAVFSGALLLFCDWQRGLVRAVAVLPMTGRQLGRTWWLASVAAPAAWQIGWLSLGAGLFCLLHPASALATARLLQADLLIFLWLGTMFVTYFVNYAIRADRWGKLSSWITSATIIWMFFGFALSSQAQKREADWCVFLSLSLLMTLYGWWRAGQFRPGQRQPNVPARSRAQPLLTPLPLKFSEVTPPVAAGREGTSLLIRIVFYRAFSFCLITAGWMLLVFAWHGQVKSWRSALECVAGLVSAYWVLSFFIFSPVLRQLRYVRTLPLTPSRLALILMAQALLPVLALGTLTTGIAWASAEAPVTLQVMHNFLFVLAPASLGLAVGLWRGARIETYAGLILLLIGFQFVLYRNLSLGLVGAIVAICALVAFLGIRLALGHSRHAYRPPVKNFGTPPWLARG